MGLGVGLGELVTEAEADGDSDALGVAAGPEQATSAPTTQASVAARTGKAERRTEVTIRHCAGVRGHRDRLALVLLERLYRWRLAVTLTLVGGLAAILRFVRLGYPDSLSFDELYYARESYSILHLGYGGSWKGDNQAFAHGDLSGLATNADKVVHPLVGKYMIGAGIWLFGPNPFGWRFACAVVGTLSVILVILIARHLFKSLVWGALAGVLLAIDGQHIVMSRTAILDIFLSFWVLVGFGLLLLDRRRARASLASRAASDRGRLGLAPDAPIPGFAGGLGVRWWRLAAIVAFGLATGVKWSGMYFCAMFMVLSVLWDLVDRRAAGYRRWISATGLRSILPAFLSTVVVYPLTYLATYWSWFASPSSYGRHWAEAHPGEGVSWLPAPCVRSSTTTRRCWISTPS